MALKDVLLAELKYETSNTRKMIERLQADKFNWKPHEKSYSLGALAVHISVIPRWISRIVSNDEFDFSKHTLVPPVATSVEDVLKIFDDFLAENIPILEAATDEILNGNWTLRRGDHIFFTLPKKVALRNMVFNHIIHHRGQLSVYLRLLDIPVPGMYGPSADEM